MNAVYSTASNWAAGTLQAVSPGTPLLPALSQVWQISASMSRPAGGQSRLQSLPPVQGPPRAQVLAPLWGGDCLANWLDQKRAGLMASEASVGLSGRRRAAFPDKVSAVCPVKERCLHRGRKARIIKQAAQIVLGSVAARLCLPGNAEITVTGLDCNIDQSARHLIRLS